ncbi:exported protein of unknown function [Candidatus Hydrogenisulfobacillus filiaventi]|uniref:Uncharacterized protein n=1 Tax=Candidatus Hydrogenisulfobacillus filiaventi TaxID=2707344 RepID=A0A6F8ZHJ9_9FIRM|nr:exported protein of unknown function [Candidatus Hydrogenisulfobacillus filiaventi]
MPRLSRILGTVSVALGLAGCGAPAPPHAHASAPHSAVPHRSHTRSAARGTAFRPPTPALAPTEPDAALAGLRWTFGAPTTPAGLPLPSGERAVAVPFTVANPTGRPLLVPVTAIGLWAGRAVYPAVPLLTTERSAAGASIPLAGTTPTERWLVVPARSQGQGTAVFALPGGPSLVGARMLVLGRVRPLG